MSVKVKYSSAFTPVSKTCKDFSHPFSIKNILNLDENTSHEEMSSSEEHPARGSVIRLSQTVIPPQPELALRYDPAAIPAWIYATRYCRQGIPPGKDQ